MSGRHPSGPEFVEKLKKGSAKAKLRAQALLETMAGTCRVLEACERLGIKEARFDQIRYDGLQGLVDALEEQQVGRKPRVQSPAEIENDQLREENARLKVELQAALLKVELAVALPRAGEPAQKKTAATKSPSRPKKSS